MLSPLTPQERSRLLRRFHLVKLLHEREWTAAELARRLVVSLKTIRRDLEEVREAYPLQERRNGEKATKVWSLR